MEDNKKNIKKPIDDIYASLSGYFPKEYDMSPEKLEEEIELENKKSAIAIGMASASKRTMEIKLEDETESEPVKDEEPIIIEKDDRDELFPAVSESIEGETNAPIASFDQEELIEEDIETIQKASDKAIDEVDEENEAESWIPPEAEDVTENELLNKFEPLDELLSELEDTTPAEEINTVENESGARKTLSWLFDFLEVFTICMVCIIVIFSFAARLTKVDGESMEDTLYDGQYLIVSDMFYTPKSGDIVVLQDMNADDPRLREPLVKRVIAVGGETVEVSIDGTVKITDENGKFRVLEEDYIKDEEYMRGPCHVTVPEGYVFVMGDNRNNSSDSRDSRLGLIDERCIFGRAVVRILPVTEFTFFKNPNE